MYIVRKKYFFRNKNLFEKFISNQMLFLKLNLFIIHNSLPIRASPVNYF